MDCRLSSFTASSHLADRTRLAPLYRLFLLVIISPTYFPDLPFHAVCCFLIHSLVYLPAFFFHFITVQDCISRSISVQDCINQSISFQDCINQSISVQDCINQSLLIGVFLSKIVLVGVFLCKIVLIRVFLSKIVLIRVFLFKIVLIRVFLSKIVLIIGSNSSPNTIDEIMLVVERGYKLHKTLIAQCM